MEQDTDMRDRVKRVVANRQLVFINGGWCMHDEAATHYVAMIDQTTLGHRFLVDEFGQFPRIGWQIDPFGHSGTQAALLSAEAGFDGLFFGRLDYQDKDLRLNQSNMETLWRGSPSLGVDAQVFTGALYTGYGPPGGLDWNTGSGDAPIQDDPRLHDVNVKERVNDAVEAALDQANHYRTNHIMWTMGSDFQYSNAETWYKNLDKLIHYGNLDGRVNFFYSTPEEYTDAKNAADLTWSVKDDDYFPYADGPHNFWTGYFTSRAALKRYVRDRTGYLQAARQLEAAAVGNSDGTAALAQALGVAQHHDAVSGTSKQHVAYDYAERIAQGDATAQKTVADSIAKLMGVKSAALTQCTSLNVSVCSAADADNGDVSVIAFNALGQRRFETVALPSSAKGVTVYNGSTVVPSTVMAQFEPAVKQLEHGGELPGPMSPYTVYFDIELEPFAFAVYTIKASEQATVAAEQIGRYDLENDHLAVTFNADTGRMETILNKDSGKTAKMTQDYLWYNSSQGYGQNSGAYIFRPNNTHAWPVNEGKVGLTIVGEEGGVMEARQQWTPWLTQTVRLHPHGRHLEIEWTVGSVPLTNNWGHEIISRFTSDIDSEDTFYTDSNGRDSMKRVRNYRPTWKLNVTEPIAGNYYPVNAFIAIYEGEGRVAAIVTDRSQGGASLESGQFELMVQRRLTADDSRGVGEPLNETTSITPYPNPEREGPGVVIRGVHHLVFGDNTFAAEEVRGLIDRVFSPPVLAFSDAADMTDAATTHHILPGELPANVQLMTLEARGQGQYLVRLSHQYGEHEHPTLSKPATVSLASLFGKVNRVEELTLTANRPLDQLHRLVWKAQDGKTPGARPATPKAPEFNVELTPMKIRTFMVTIEGEAL